MLERPTYDLTVFKVHFGRQTLKIYTKGERVLRIEAITHNAADLRCGKVLEKFPVIVEHLAAMLERFLEVLHCIDISALTDTVLDDLPLPTRLGQAKLAGVDLNKPRTQAVFEALIAVAQSPDGFTSAQLSDQVYRITGQPYTARQAAYDIRKLRGKDFIRLADRRARYLATPTGLKTMTALLVLRNKVIQPVLAGVTGSRRGRPPKNPSPIDENYRRLHTEMHNLFNVLGIAA